ncbi:type I toxin-antitoxin system toxin Ldr family protein [Escherichia coli]|nr:type I toxin-antitoxin system toxin Ldr family protein [Escherichia coli]
MTPRRMTHDLAAPILAIITAAIVGWRPGNAACRDGNMRPKPAAGNSLRPLYPTHKVLTQR